MGTIDAQLIAIDAVSGRPIWQTAVADPGAGYALTLAPLIVKDKVIVSVAGGEYGIRGFISAHDPETGEEEWRFYTIPGPGEPGHDTWEGDDWRYGGASAWITGSYDPDADLIYWGIGNPGPDWNPAQRPGDNLYSDSVVALDPDTGELEWYFQFTPNDPYDYDSVQVPVLADFPAQDGSTLKLMLWGNRNGFFYVLDRETGRFINGQEFIEQTWAEGLDDNGRPIFIPQEPGATTYPGVQGGTNWYSPSYSPSTRLFYLSAWRLRIGLRGAGGRVRGGTAVPRRPAGPARARRRASQPGARPHQHVDRVRGHGPPSSPSTRPPASRPGSTR